MAEALHVFEDPVTLMTGMWPTPLIKLRWISRNGAEAWAKLEFYNPFSKSTKDRPVWFMIEDALRRGVLKEGGVFYEATSGNVGIAMASLANVLGLKFRAYLPKHAPRATEVILKVLGAEVVRTEYECISEEMVNKVKEEARRDGAVNLNQYINDCNFLAHLNHTARELDEQLRAVGKSPPKAIIAGVGTSGHSAAIAKHFREKYSDEAPAFVAVVPRERESIPGLRPLSTKPKWVSVIKPDKVVEVSTEDAVAGAVLVARTNGLFVGLSSGAVVAAYEAVKDELGAGTYALIFPDDGMKYVEIFDAWLRHRPDLLRKYADILASGVCREDEGSDG